MRAKRCADSAGISALYTIGYEGASLDEVVAQLRKHCVTILVDVRERPLSRKKGLSKTKLSQALAGAGIMYRHERPLGAPSEIRQALKQTKDLKAYFQAFNAYIATQGATLQALSGSLSGSVALLCYERDPAECHRSVVAAQLGKLVSVTPEHLYAALGVSEATRRNPRQGIPAT